MRVEIDLLLPDGDVPEGTAPEAVVKELTKQFSQLEKELPRTSGKKIAKRRAPPPTALGMADLIQWAVTYKGEIELAITVIRALIEGVDAIYRTWIRKPKRTQKNKNKSSGPSLVLRIDEAEIQVPATPEEIEAFLDRVSKGASRD